MSPDLRILIVADDPLVRAGLAALLAEQPGCLVAGRVTGADDLGAALEIYRPDILLWDLGWDPEPAVATLTDYVSTFGMGKPVAVLLSDGNHAARVWSAGARVFLPRNADPGHLVAALTVAAYGLAVIAPEFADVLIHIPGDIATPEALAERADLVEELTPRELEVLRLLAEGLPNKTIALRLGISEHTVKFHVNAILGKLAVGSRTEAVVRATRLGLIPL
jgi:two-component system nitrate/nitrite response regulator NarL